MADLAFVSLPAAPSWAPPARSSGPSVPRAEPQRADRAGSASSSSTPPWRGGVFLLGAAAARRLRRHQTSRRAKGGQVRTLSPELEAFLRTATSAAAPGKGGDASIQGLFRTDDAWRRVKERALKKAKGEPLQPPPEVVKRHVSKSPATGESASWPKVDIAVCGGTLGILMARALQEAGHSVCVIERGEVRGRDQEWNISPEELQPLLDEGVISKEELAAAVTSSWPQSRVGVEGARPIRFEAAALNAGVSPAVLVAAARAHFEKAGGLLLEKVALEAIDVHDDIAVLRLGGGGGVKARLVIDAMGAASPIVFQARGGAPPDAACLVVGTMASGFPVEKNKGGDYLYSLAPGPNGRQAFWEAFPATSGGPSGTDRTTYYFTYVLPGLDNLPDLADVFEDYLKALPKYQDVPVEALKVCRALCAHFVAYQDSPLASRFDRVLQIGDAAGIQSPLSFGGFAALCRHLKRIRSATGEALEADLLSKEHLALMNQYLPNLSLQWTMYRSIAQPPASEPDFVNRVMGGILSSAAACGEEVMLPILQDVFSLEALAPTLVQWISKDPGVLPLFVLSMGPGGVASALQHVGNMAAYTALSKFVAPLIRPAVSSLPPAERFSWKRQMEAWEYGSGLDYKPSHTEESKKK